MSGNVIELTAMNGSIGLNGPITCPECGESVMHTVVADPRETGTEPSYVRCMLGHTWAEPGLPRNLLAEWLAGMERHDPEVWREALHVMRERGHIVTPAFAMRLVGG